MGKRNLSDLVVVNGTAYTHDGIFTLTTCGHHVSIGLKETFPPAIQDSNNPNILKGKEAYTLLLQLACGLDSEKAGEHHIMGQLKKTWDKWSPTHKTELTDFMNDVFADAKYIRSTIVDPAYHFTDFSQPGKRSEKALAGRLLAGIKKGDTVLLVAHGADITEDIARAIGRDNNHSVAEIIITHPDEGALRHHYAELGQAQRRGLIKSKITSMPFDTAISEGLMRANHTIVSLPAGLNPDADRRIIEAWQKRVDPQGFLVLLSQTSTKNNLWNAAHLTHYISPDAVTAKMNEMKDAFHKTLDRASKACDYAAEARIRGLFSGKVQHVVKTFLDLDQDALMNELTTLCAVQDRFRPDHHKSTHK